MLYYNISTQLVAYIKKSILCFASLPQFLQLIVALVGQPTLFLTTRTEICNIFIDLLVQGRGWKNFLIGFFTAADINPHVPRVSASGVLTGDCALIGELGHKQNNRVLYPCLRSAGIYIDWRITPPPSLGFLTFIMSKIDPYSDTCNKVFSDNNTQLITYCFMVYIIPTHSLTRGSLHLVEGHV